MGIAWFIEMLLGLSVLTVFRLAIDCDQNVRLLDGGAVATPGS